MKHFILTDMELKPSAEVRRRVEADRQEIRNILDGTDRRLLAIVGPCSAWPEEAVLKYAGKLRKFSDTVADSLKIVMRVYTQKPRTVDGWNGLLAQPDPFAGPDMDDGLRRASILMEQIVSLGLPVADEALFLAPSLVLSRWLSWTAIGARSAEDQEHRAYASGIGIPVGMKHPTSGSIPVGVNGVLAARSPQFSPLFSTDSFTAGNPYAHLVLRGGESGTNFDAEHIVSAGRLMKDKGIEHPAIVVDASHDNARVDGVKDPSRQIGVIFEMLSGVSGNQEARGYFRGFMLESFLCSGSQDFRKSDTGRIDRRGCSVTDPCLSWEETEKLLLEVARRFRER
ncbi:MAG: 3-deoxy-7-phosphoheptulonate synthase [Candidatus Moraniibacteriota bacterium]